MSDEKNPVDTLRDGSLKVAIFRNRAENGDYFSLSPGRIYTDENGEVRETKTLSGAEPLRMARLLNRGYARVAEFRAQMKEERTSRSQNRGQRQRRQDRA